MELCQKSLGGLTPQEYAETMAGLQLTLAARGVNIAAFMTLRSV